MKRMVVIPIISLMLPAFMLIGSAVAQKTGSSPHGSSSYGASPHGSPKDHPGTPSTKGHPMSPKTDKGYTPPGHPMSSTMGPQWKDTLNDGQKKKANKMHLELEKNTSVIKAKKDVRKKELRLLLIQDKPDKAAIENKIGEITKLAGDLMVKYMNHKIEIRAMLTPDQRASFDMGILKGSPHGK